MIDMPTACTPQVQIYRNMYYSTAARSIGLLPVAGKEGQLTLDRAAIPGYLVSIGCPHLFEMSLSLPMIKQTNVLTAIDEAAKTGEFPDDAAGMAVSGKRIDTLRYAAVTSSEFLRRKRTVAWRSAEAILATAPRRVIKSEEDEDVNDEFFTITNIYELLVIHGVQPIGLTEYEERTLGKVLSTRLAMGVPTVVLLVPEFGGQTSPISQYLVDNYLSVIL